MKYITRFIRKDGQPNEEYYWNKESDAVKHLELFTDDDSDLYERIEVVDENDRRMIEFLKIFLDKNICYYYNYQASKIWRQ